jgi:hypothetical protein
MASRGANFDQASRCLALNSMNGSAAVVRTGCVVMGKTQSRPEALGINTPRVGNRKAPRSANL